MDSIITINAFGDNLIYLYQYDKEHAFVVDPGDAGPVLQLLRQQGLKLTDILVTHHHWDHTGAIVQLKKLSGCKVIGGDGDRIPAIDCVLGDRDIITVGKVKICSIATPGHTHSSVCYYIEEPGDEEKSSVLTGDTLFVGGCGRCFECNAETMWRSLQKLAAIPGDTLVYPGHDYAVENYEFALLIEPDNEMVRQRLQQVRQARKKGMQAVPSTISQEKLTNPFLRFCSVELKAALEMSAAGPEYVFAELRRRKDFF
jgi:hydroxyacylglutathione hydrolase